MNRGPFINGWIRYNATKGSNSVRSHKPSLLRRIINIVCFILGIALLAFIIVNGLMGIFMPTAIFFLVLLSIPTAMSVGKGLMMAENEIAINQRRADLPLEFSRKKAIWGYILMFGPLYLLMLACFFFPAYNAWIVPYIPIFVYTTISLVLSMYSVENFQFNAKKYKIIHIALYITIFALGLCVRAYIIMPWLALHG